MNLDLRKNGHLEVDFIKKINQIEPLVRDEYNKYIEDLTKANNFKDLDWLLDVSCRNTYSSMIHNYMCKLALLESLLDENINIKKIIVDDQVISNVIHQIIASRNLYIPVKYDGKKANLLLKVFRNIIASFYLSFNAYISTKIIRSKNTIKGELIILENFIFEDSFDEEYNIVDRNYPGIMDYFSQNQTDKVWYVSTIIGIQHLHQRIKFLNKVNLSKDKIIIKDYFLKLGDYLSAFHCSLTIPFKIKHIPKWRNIDISQLILAEAKNEIGSYGLISNVLYYRFFKRLQYKGITIKLVFDWNENQVIDRALNLGVRKYFPKALIKGYQGYLVSDYYASLTPKKFELENGLIPHQLYVISKYLLENRKKYCSDLNVMIAPAFRYMEAIEYSNKDFENKRKMLVALPMLYKESEQVLRMVLEAVKDIEIEILVKRHPTTLLKDLLLNVKHANNSKLNFTENKLTNLFKEATLLVTMTSSAAIESVMCNTYVAIIAHSSGPSTNPLKDIVEQKYWQLCYTHNCISEALNYSNKNNQLGKKDYLVPLNSKTIDNFIKI